MGKHHYVTYDDGDTRKYRMHLHCFKVLDKATGAVTRDVNFCVVPVPRPAARWAPLSRLSELGRRW